MELWTNAANFASCCAVNLHWHDHSVAIREYDLDLCSLAFDLSLIGTGEPDTTQSTTMAMNSDTSASDGADTDSSPELTSRSAPVRSEHDYPNQDFRQHNKWLLQTQVLAIFLFLMYFFRLVTNAETGGGGADRGFIAMLDYGNLGGQLYIGFPQNMGWPPLALIISITFSVLWALLLEELSIRYARNAKERSMLWYFALSLNLLWFVAHLCSWLAIYYRYVERPSEAAATVISGVLMAIGVFGYYFTLILVSLAELGSRKQDKKLLSTNGIEAPL